MTKGTLFDASSLILALKLRKIQALRNCYIQWLTVYEVMNALWKEASLKHTLSPNEAEKIVEVLEKLLYFLHILDPLQREVDILKLASRLKITAYDASYIVQARDNELELVTEDEELRSKATEFVKSLSFKELIKTS